MFRSQFSRYVDFSHHGLPTGKTIANAKKHIDLTLYLVTHRESVSSEEAFIQRVLSAVQGGVTCVQLRDTYAQKHLLISSALKLKKLLTPLRVPLIINNHLDVALAVGADGLHLGQKDASYTEARQMLGKKAIIGLSVNNWSELEKAEGLDADYLGVSQVFPSPRTKPGCLEPWGVEGLKRVRSFSKHRLVAIGGLNRENLPQICSELQQGDGIAMVGDLWRCETPARVAKEIRSLIENSMQKRADHV